MNAQSLAMELVRVASKKDPNGAIKALEAAYRKLSQGKSLEQKRFLKRSVLLRMLLPEIEKKR